MGGNFFFEWAIPGLFFFIFVLVGSQLTDKYVRCISLPMSGFKPRIPGVGSDRSANCPATTALGWGQHIKVVNLLASRLSCPRSELGTIPEFFSGKKFVDVAEVNQQPWLEASRQWHQTHLVLACGKLVIQKLNLKKNDFKISFIVM